MHAYAGPGASLVITQHPMTSLEAVPNLPNVAGAIRHGPAGHKPPTLGPCGCMASNSFHIAFGGDAEEHTTNCVIWDAVWPHHDSIRRATQLDRNVLKYRCTRVLSSWLDKSRGRRPEIIDPLAYVADSLPKQDPWLPCCWAPITLFRSSKTANGRGKTRCVVELVLKLWCYFGGTTY